ncbi:IclR family transcriptional regulator [Chromohalobacter sp. HP20-39]|uniref:IclR family transcriptional regulator n=1 Tax=Chromohalobacter sp. HP20-39 TaxID=3079306 RepID=UPI00294AAB96|nr:IclR family transcriptional regulator [Chromohalobacter sp. HP20-39]MDV6317995.1 IclR family transcriptional regulator [Chromohalobacter sp. HP20-39]
MSSVKGAQSISRTLQVLRVIAGGLGEGVKLSWITRRTGLAKPTAHRLLQALLAEGMVEKSESEGYFLGPECYVLGVIADQRYGLSHIASEPVARIAAECGDSAFFSIRSEWHSLCLVRKDGNYPIKTHVLQPGTRLPLGVGGGGIAMLSALGDDEVEQCLVANAEECAEHYPHDQRADQLRRIAECRELGYGINRGSVVAVSWGIGAVVRDPRGEVLGTLSIAAIESRLQPERQQVLGPQLVREAAALERKIQEAQRMRQ